MKNQKNLRLQVRLQTERVGLNQTFSPTVALPLFPARKIPVAHRPAVEELLVIKHVAPAVAA
jgi:hypothetical protein